MLSVAGSTQAAAAEAASVDGAAPACVRYSTSWRYTFVSNGCDTPQQVTVEYRDGTSVPCRTAAPGDTVTFPGYGTTGNEVLGVAVCGTTPA
ncbi:alpha-amylase [Streptomyces sp. NPDC006368]|uniref:alpha-amylase n=1 Tax=Streptomyces sp. NPDC006368 TaxID=3156760 RepID=UPI0033AC8B75